MDETRKRQLRREFGLNHDDEISAAEFAIMDKLSELDQKLNERPGDDTFFGT